MILLGDWHAGLSMLQSINNIFWDGHLQPFVMAMKWKILQKDARGCYYQASRLVLFVYQQMTRLLCQSFVSDQLELLQSKFDEEHTNDSMANFVCFCGCQLQRLDSQPTGQR